MITFLRIENSLWILQHKDTGDLDKSYFNGVVKLNPVWSKLKGKCEEKN